MRDYSIRSSFESLFHVLTPHHWYQIIISDDSRITGTNVELQKSCKDERRKSPIMKVGCIVNYVDQA